jgi:hypothetical protein
MAMVENMAMLYIMAMLGVTMTRSASPIGQGQQAESEVADLFTSHGWRVEPFPRDRGRGPDLIVKRGAQQFVVEVKAVAEARADRALPLLSQAILQAKAHAREVKGAKPLAILWVAHASPTLAGQVRSFAENYAEGVPVGVLSGNGLRSFVGEPFAKLNSEPRSNKWPETHSHRQVINLFSDLNQWMLKILLAKEIPEDLLSAPRTDCRSGAELASLGGVSAMSASRFLLQLRSEGFLDEQSRAPRLVRRKELFERWRNAAVRPAAEMPMRFVIRSPVREQLRELIAKQQGEACLGLFAAADALKFGHVSGVPAHVCVSELPRPGDSRWRALRPASLGELPDIIVRRVPFPNSMFRGAVERDGGLTSDVIQTWLDVANHPARGNEQADLIYKKFLRRIVEQDS